MSTVLKKKKKKALYDRKTSHSKVIFFNIIVLLVFTSWSKIPLKHQCCRMGLAFTLNINQVTFHEKKKNLYQTVILFGGS